MVDLCAYKLLSEGGLYHDSAPLMRIYIMYRDILMPGWSTYKKGDRECHARPYCYHKRQKYKYRLATITIVLHHLLIGVHLKLWDGIN